MIATFDNIFYSTGGSFFDYWHYDDIEIISKLPVKKTADEIEKKIMVKQFCEEMPAHCIQLLYLS